MSTTKQRDRALLVALRGVANGEPIHKATGKLIGFLYEPGPEPTAAEERQVVILRAAIGGIPDEAADDPDGDASED